MAGEERKLGCRVCSRVLVTADLTLSGTEPPFPVDIPNPKQPNAFTFIKRLLRNPVVQIKVINFCSYEATVVRYTDVFPLVVLRQKTSRYTICKWKLNLLL